MSDFLSVGIADVVSIFILLVTAWAVYYGPIKAVKIAREEETKASAIRLKSEIFASLMKTRRFQLDTEHVSALNLIQVYFSDVPSVLLAYKEYIKLLSRRSIPGIVDESLWKERDNAFIDLVFEIAKALGYQQDRKEIEELAYSPEGWANDHATVRKLHSLMIDLFEQRRALPITPMIRSAGNDPFPPAPIERE